MRITSAITLGLAAFAFPVAAQVPQPAQSALTYGTPWQAEIYSGYAYSPADLKGHPQWDAAHRCWRTMVQADRVLKKFRGRFIGKSSPSHFWWGGFDLACTRFSGRPAPPHPGGSPNCPDYVTLEGYSHECISAGW